MTTRFPHQKLDAWARAVDARRMTVTALNALPKGFADDKRQITRAAQAVPKLVAEGADRWAVGQKRQRFEEAIAEAGEAASGLSELTMVGALTEAQVEPAHAMWGRVRAMLIGLIRRLDSRSPQR